MIEYEGQQYDEAEKIGASRAAEIAQRHRRTILSWCKKGLIPSRKMPGTRGRYELTIGDLVTALTKPGYDPSTD